MIDITIEDDNLYVKSPYTEDMSPRARQVGGSWKAEREAWQFDVRDEARVRAMCIEVYGTDGVPTDTVTVHLELTGREHFKCIDLFGRPLVTRRYKDSPVKFGQDVVLVSGEFPSSGGSVANPRLAAKTGTVLEVKDIPAGHRHLDLACVTIIDRQTDRDLLIAERDKLLARLAEIDAALEVEN